MIRRATIVLLMLLVASCTFTRKHPRVTLVSATTVIFSAAIGAPLATDCDNATSTCSGGEVVGGFGIGAAVGLGIGLLTAHELDAAEPDARVVYDPASTICGRARQRIARHLMSACSSGAVVFPTAGECQCHRRQGDADFECRIEGIVACGSDEIEAICRCTEDAGGGTDGCRCLTSAAGGVP